MDTSTHRYFIALLPPQDIQDSITAIKQYFADTYDSRAALKSPPHITLQPPFVWEVKQIKLLNKYLQEFAQQQESISITLSGFAAFVPRVIYVNVIKSPELIKLHSDLIAYTETNLNIIDPSSKQRAYSPHVTVAFRDLTKQNFRTAWPDFQQRSIYFEFLVTHLTLLIHDGKKWHINAEFPFKVKID